MFLAYVIARLIDDPHLRVRTLCDELEDVGYAMSYQTLHRKIRELKLRPICQACLTVTATVTVTATERSHRSPAR